MSRVVPPLLHMPSWLAHIKLIFYNFSDLGLATNILRYSESHLVWVTHTGQLQAVPPCALKDEVRI
jgi:hypothetical protein